MVIKTTGGNKDHAVCSQIRIIRWHWNSLYSDLLDSAFTILIDSSLMEYNRVAYLVLDEMEHQ